VIGQDSRTLRLKSRFGPRAGKISDRSPWNWYAPSCTCGLMPGECRTHPRSLAGPSNGPAWRTIASRNWCGHQKIKLDARPKKRGILAVAPVSRKVSLNLTPMFTRSSSCWTAP
jgi:hypothetical protein